MNFRNIILFAFTFLSIVANAQSSRKIKLSPVNLGMDLPQSYKQRTFIKGLSGFTNKIDQLVGAMILVEDNKTSVLTRFVRNDKPPVVTTSTSDVVYCAKIDSKFKFNGAYSIASTKVEKDKIYELIVTDIGYAFLPEDYIPYLEICRAAINVAPETRKKTYYVRSAKLSTVYTRAYQKVIGRRPAPAQCRHPTGQRHGRQCPSRPAKRRQPRKRNLDFQKQRRQSARNQNPRRTFGREVAVAGV